MQKRAVASGSDAPSSAMCAAIWKAPARDRPRDVEKPRPDLLRAAGPRPPTAPMSSTSSSHGLLEQVLGPDHRDRVGVPAQDLEHLRVRDDQLEVRAVGVEDPLLEADAGLPPHLAGACARLLGELLEDGSERVLLVVEVVVEGARGEIGLAHDVARRRRPEPLLARTPCAPRPAASRGSRASARPGVCSCRQDDLPELPALREALVGRLRLARAGTSRPRGPSPLPTRSAEARASRPCAPYRPSPRAGGRAASRP